MTTKTSTITKNGSLKANPENSVWQKAITANSQWDDKDEFLDVIYWSRQVFGIILGVVWGIIPLKGLIGLALFAAISCAIVYLYSVNFQSIDEEEYGGVWELMKEGFVASFAGFIVTWIVFYTASAKTRQKEPPSPDVKKFSTEMDKLSRLFNQSLRISSQIRYKSMMIEKPKPGTGVAYRRIVHYPEDGKYTVQPLKITHLAGRDPETGRLVAKGIGGGLKHKYHWIKWDREGPLEGPPQIEKVLDVIFDGCRTSKVAVVGCGDDVKYILATENMKPGDLIKTSKFIPRIPVRPNEGDAFPLGALPVGTRIHCLEKNPGQPCHLIHAAGTYGTILRKFDDKVVVQLPSKREFAFDRTCMATVGRVSNIEHDKTPVGSAQKMRELGNRPRSGLWKRKEGRHGRKIRKLPPMSNITPPKAPEEKPIFLSMPL